MTEPTKPSSTFLTKKVMDTAPTNLGASVSVVIPVFNQAETIRFQLEAIADHADLDWELIVIDDASDDDTIREIICTVRRLQSSPRPPVRSRVYRNLISQYESFCDSFGIAQATAPVVIEIQADMFLADPSFMSRMHSVLLDSTDLLMISGRGTHSLEQVSSAYIESNGSDRRPTSISFGRLLIQWLAEGLSRPRSIFRKEQSGENLTAGPSLHPDGGRLKLAPEQIQGIFPDSFEFSKTRAAGRLDATVELNFEIPESQKGKVWIGETVMRGPMGIHVARYNEVGGLNTKNFFQGFDDHDLARRGLLDFGYYVGFHPVQFFSPLSLGSTRKKRSPKSELALRVQILRISHAGKTSLSKSLPNLDRPHLWSVRKIELDGNSTVGV